MQKHLISLSIYFFCGVLHAQPPGIVSTDILPYSRFQSSAFAFSSNEAALADLQHFACGIYGERKFLLQQLAWYHLVMGFPVSGGQFGIQAVYSGSDLQREMKLGLAYARRLGTTAIGLGFNRHSIATKGYRQVSFLSVEGGILMNLGAALRLGCHVTHTAGPPGQNYNIPSKYIVGLGYDASRQFFIGIAFAKTEGRDAQVETGFEYMLQSMMRIRAGLSTTTEAALFYFGIGLSLHDFWLDVNASIHPQLGITPGIALSYPSISKE